MSDGHPCPVEWCVNRAPSDRLLCPECEACLPTVLLQAITSRSGVDGWGRPCINPQAASRALSWLDEHGCAAPRPTGPTQRTGGPQWPRQH